MLCDHDPDNVEVEDDKYENSSIDELQSKLVLLDQVRNAQSAPR